MSLKIPYLSFVLAAVLVGAEPLSPVRFNTTFENASIGQVQRLSATEFRLRVAGQANNEGRNRQATWYYFRIDQVLGRELTLTLTDFVGEHRGRPSLPMGPRLRPVYSYDGEHWTHFGDLEWNVEKAEATLRFTPEKDTVWIAHQPPYPTSRLEKLLTEVERSPLVRVEVVGKTVEGRLMRLVTVEGPTEDAVSRKTIWVQAREHAWESGTSFVMEGALQFILSDDPRAVQLRKEYDWVFTPMVDLDGCVAGRVRYNANGFDVANWGEVDLASKEWLQRTPEVWYLKKALRDYSARKPVLIFVNLHNTEMNEYLVGATWDAEAAERIKKLEGILAAETRFDQHTALVLRSDRSVDDRTGRARAEGGKDVPYLLLETRIGPGKKLGGLPKVSDRLAFGPELLEALAKTYRN